MLSDEHMSNIIVNDRNKRKMLTFLYTGTYRQGICRGQLIHVVLFSTGLAWYKFGVMDPLKVC